MQNTNSETKIKEINCNELLEIINLDTNAKLIDVRDQPYYENNHIKGAISIPLKELHERDLGFLKKDDTIITYCSELKCPASTTAAKILLSLGYKNVLDYKGGLEDYKKAKLPLESSAYGTK